MRQRLQIPCVLAGLTTSTAKLHLECQRPLEYGSDMKIQGNLSLCACAVVSMDDSRTLRRALTSETGGFPASESDPMEKHYAGFVKMMRTDDIMELSITYPLAFVLATIIALRARFQPGQSMIGLNPGEAYIGDYKACGMSRQEYRTAKTKLASLQFATFKATNKGTIAKLTDTRLFDVLNVAGNHPNNHQTTSEQPLTNNGNTGKTENNTETGVLQRLCVSEVVSYSLSRNFKTSEVETWIARQDFNRPAGEIIDSFRNNDLKEALQWAFRFIHYNNLHGWQLTCSWKSAFDGFREKCDHGSGPADVPQGWIPVILTPKLCNA